MASPSWWVNSMSAQFTHDQSFPAPCRHCGGVLYQYVESCPYCGMMRPLDGSTQTRAAAVPPASPSPPPSPAPSMPHAAKVATAGAAASERPVKPDYQPHAPFAPAPQYAQPGKGVLAKAFLFAAFALLIAFAVYLMFGESRKQDSTSGDQSAHSSGGRISLFSLRHMPSASPDTNTNAGTSASNNAPARAPASLQFKDVPDSLRAARASLAANNLADAKSANDAALAHEADNSDARQIQRDIAGREQRRDSALQNADRCAAQRAWACVQQQASEALAIDSSSAPAQSLMERAILATAWTPLSASASTAQPAAPKPANSGSSDNNANSGTNSSTDAQQRAILQSGWKNATPSSAAH